MWWRATLPNSSSPLAASSFRATNTRGPMALWKPMSVGRPRTVPRMTKEELPTCRVSPRLTPSWMGIASSTIATPGSPRRDQMPGGAVSTRP